LSLQGEVQEAARANADTPQSAALRNQRYAETMNAAVERGNAAVVQAQEASGGVGWFYSFCACGCVPVQRVRMP